MHKVEYKIWLGVPEANDIEVIAVTSELDFHKYVVRAAHTAVPGTEIELFRNGQEVCGVKRTAVGWEPIRYFTSDEDWELRDKEDLGLDRLAS